MPRAAGASARTEPQKPSGTLVLDHPYGAIRGDGDVTDASLHGEALVFVGGVFVMEALSVILQVASFKLTGRRIFLCSPLHHHFEIRKDRPWSETQITIRFWIMSIICALAGILLLKIR